MKGLRRKGDAIKTKARIQKISGQAPRTMPLELQLEAK
jgi:hypothetical protein